MIYDTTEALANLRKLSDSFPRTKDITSLIIEDSKFQIWTGSSRPLTHHYGKGGLIVHTNEVINLSNDVNARMNFPVDPELLFVAGLYHDVGKLWDYKPASADYEEWTSSAHKKLIHHISQSSLYFNQCSGLCLGWQEQQDITHAILAHHGRREWGSPVEPHTKMAWILHLCDNMSARLADCNYV